MLKKNVLKTILSFIILLLPILYGVIMWDSLPDVMTIHWGADGNPDGVGGKALAVFGLPAILLALHLLCLVATSLDKKQAQQNAKAVGIVFWIVPAISLFVNGIMYQAAFGKEFDVSFFIPLLAGAMFLFIGNYMPKVKQNSTLGIKLCWTLNNEENWNKTHRFAGKLWAIGGLVLLFAAFLPLMAAVWAMVGVMAVMVILPIVYSYRIYKKHQKEGVHYFTVPKSKAEKVARKITAVVLPLILVGTAILMFTGNLQVACGDTALEIHATYWTDVEIDYSQIDTVAYREDLDMGVRTYGFASARLSFGIFQNNEFGKYTLYAYTGAKAYIVLTSGENTLVIGLRDTETVQTIYNTTLNKIAE